MTTFIGRLEPEPGRPRLAVKDLIDLQGIPTTAGSRLIATTAEPALGDAACIRGARQAGATIVGKTNLVELAFGTVGVNPWFGTPLNPIDPALIPGGSSSGSAVAVAAGEAELAYGTDTGGSIRIPAACCGIAGLKTTHGRVSTEGVRPLAPSMDTVGPMAPSVVGLVMGMGWLEPGFRAAASHLDCLGRLRLWPSPGASGPRGRRGEPGAVGAVDPLIDQAIDAVLAAAGIDVVEVSLPGWEAAWTAGTRLLEAEAAWSNRSLLGRLDRIDPVVAERLARGATIAPAQVAEAREHQRRWCSQVADALAQAEALVCPTLVGLPPRLDDGVHFPLTFATGPVNLAGLPALALPVPTGTRLPASLQLIGASNSEESLLATGLLLEAAAASLRG